MADNGRITKKSPFGHLLQAVAEEYEKIGPWNDDLQKDLPKKWEKHGDMVLLPEHSFTLPEWRKLGDCYSDVFSNSQIDNFTVLYVWRCLKDIVSGRSLWMVVAKCLQAERLGRKRRIEKDDYRSPHIELLYGTNGWVEHVDNGIKYHYDVTKCMFSIGNINEKLRIANFDCKNETVIDMFAGIGYFTLPYLVHAKASTLHACEWNADAVEALTKNLDANKVTDRCVIHEGDCRKVCPIGIADRVNLGLLPTARAYWLTACKALKSTGGILHVHENVTSSKLKKLSKQESISNSDVFAGNSITIQYCREDDDSTTGSRNVSVTEDTIMEDGDRKTSAHVNDQSTIDRRDSLLDEEMDVYEPLISENLRTEWNSTMDSSWKQFSIATARRIRRFLNNLHHAEWDVTVLRIGKVKAYAPRIDHIVLDLECRPKKNE